MASLTDPWDALEELESRFHQPDFYKRWRAFLRGCSLLLLPDLPTEVGDWITAADEFEQGHLSEAQLTDMRVQACQFHKAQEGTAPLRELSGLHVVMYRLWPNEDADHWYDEAHQFLHLCEEAGLQPQQWWRLLHEQFPDIVLTTRGD